jgi:putative heme-binding domain-containing protein
MKERTQEELQELLAHQDMRVRMEAQFELVNRKASDVLLNTALSSVVQLGRLHAIWGLGQLARQDYFELNEIVSLFEDQDEEIRAQTAKIFGEAKFEPAFDQLLSLLTDQSPRAQFFATEALGKLAKPEAFDPLVQLLAHNADSDLHLRHALILALSRLGDENALAALAEHPSIQVRLGAIVALRRQKSEALSIFLEDDNPWVLAEAARAIHDDFSIPSALPALANALQDASIMDTAFILRAINANLRLGKTENAQTLTNFAARTDVPEYFRQEALYALSYWPKPPILDRVDNRYRVLPERPFRDALNALEQHQGKLLTGNSEQVLMAAIYTFGQLKMQSSASAIISFFRNKSADQKLRLSALQSLVKMEVEEIGEILEEALSDRDQLIREAAQSLLGETSLPEATVVALLAKVLEENSIREKQKALASLSQISSTTAQEILTQWFRKMEKGEIDKALNLDVLIAVQGSPVEALQNLAAAYEQNLSKLPVLEQLAACLEGGDAARGRSVFYENNAAQCIRCHIIEGKGGEAGPDLTAIATQLNPQQLLQSMIEPNARIAPGYGTVILSLKNGEELSGVILEETKDYFRIQNAKTADRLINKADITNSEKLPSGMFNMSEVLTRSELRDLIAFLKTLKGKVN